MSSFELKSLLSLLDLMFQGSIDSAGFKMSLLMGFVSSFVMHSCMEGMNASLLSSVDFEWFMCIDLNIACMLCYV